MTTSSQRNSRTPAKQHQILRSLRRQIVDGIYKPGNQLPLRHVLQQEYDVSSATLQSALTRLIDDGFVRSQGRSGTYVVDHPPHLTRYGIAFPTAPRTPGVRSRFWDALTDVVSDHSDELAPREYPIYHDVDGHIDSPPCRKLYSDMQSQRLAGVIFVLVRWQEWEHSRLAESSSAPTLVITTEPDRWDVPSIVPDIGALIDRALDDLAKRRRRRIAILTVTNAAPQWYERFMSGIVQRGMETKPYWTQCIAWPETQWAHNLAHLMFQPDAPDRPDGLIILDDNIIEHTVSGLAAAGIRGPQDLEIVAHANFPGSVASILPIRRLGFDVRQILQIATDHIDQVRRGENAAAIHTVAPVFEHELDRA